MITYRGTEGVIKETDQPMGLYFVFYDDHGAEEQIVEVSEYELIPFTREEQIDRSPEDEEPIPTPEWTYHNNLAMERLPASEVLKIVPSPVSVKTANGALEVSDKLVIFASPELKGESSYLAESLKDLTGDTFQVSEPVDKGTIGHDSRNVLHLCRHQDCYPGP